MIRTIRPTDLVALVAFEGRCPPNEARVRAALGRTRLRELGERVRVASPETKVVLWARDEASMEVLDPGASAPRRVFTAVPQELRSELSRCQVNRVEE